MRFSQDGKFEKNILRRGQGPGEVQTYYDLALHEGMVYVWDSVSNKLVQWNRDGQLIQEMRLEGLNFDNFYGLFKSMFIFSKTTYPKFEKKQGKLQDIKRSFILVNRDLSIFQESQGLPVKYFIGESFMMTWDPFITALIRDNCHVFVNHTDEYLIEMLDIEKGKMIRRFSRDYRRIKQNVDFSIVSLPMKIKIPKKKYKNDIQNLFFDKNQIWVVTSSVHKKKGILIDVFDTQGRYIDNFHINIKGKILAVNDGYIFFIERSPKDTILIVKYEILE